MCGNFLPRIARMTRIEQEKIKKPIIKFHDILYPCYPCNPWQNRIYKDF